MFHKIILLVPGLLETPKKEKFWDIRDTIKENTSEFVQETQEKWRSLVLGTFFPTFFLLLIKKRGVVQSRHRDLMFLNFSVPYSTH